MKSAKYTLILITTALILQSCSWFHRLQIKNTTNSNWQIEYEILDERGIFKNQIYTENKKEQLQEFDGRIMKFEIEPDQTVQVGMARNSHYDVYKEISEFNEEIAWGAFINIGEIRVFNNHTSFSIKPNELDNVLSKNSRGIARIDLKKVIEVAGGLP